MKKKICALLIVVILIVNALCGCNGLGGSGGSNKSTNSVPDFSKSNKKLNFMTYSVPLPTDEQFQLYKEAGLRTMLMSGEYLGFYQGKPVVRDGVDLETLESFFSLADKYGINILDFSMDMQTIVSSNDRCAIYNKYPNVFKGFFIGDEPGIYAIDQMANYIDWVNLNYNCATFTTTLHPSWAPESEYNEDVIDDSKKVGSIEEYYKYMVENVLEKMDGEKILCADDYPCKRDGFHGEEFLLTLFYMSNAAYSNPKIIKQMCLNCSTFREVNESNVDGAGRPETEWQGQYEKDVTEMEIRMPAITSLAFGFTSFLYFMYGPFPHSDDQTINRTGCTATKNKSPIDWVSSNEVAKTDYYDYVKNTTLELESFEKCFASFKWYGTHMIAQSGIYDNTISLINNQYDRYTKTFSSLTSYSATGNADVAIGYFKQGKSREGYFVSNFCGYSDKSQRKKDSKTGIFLNAESYAYNKKATVTLKFNNYDTVYLVKNGETITDRALVKHALTQELKPGEYMFVIPY